MRVLGFSKYWDKLLADSFTTFRFQRKDKDWQLHEQVKIVIHPRQKGGGKYLGIAEVIKKDSGLFFHSRVGITKEELDKEAIADGFLNYAEMCIWFGKAYKDRVFLEPMNKLTLEWRGMRVL